MSQFLEFVEKTVEKAIEKASTELSIPVEKLRYDVISYGSTGIFGLVGVKKAKIRVDIVQKRNKSSFRKNVSRGKEKKNLPCPKLISPMSKDQEVQNDPDAQNNMDVRNGQNAQDDPAMEEYSNIGLEVLKKIVDGITDDATIQSSFGRGKLHYDVIGGNTGVLIGKKGQTLEAIQYLVEKILNKKCEKRIRVHVDIEGYLKGKKEKLEQQAAKLAEKATKTGKPVPMGQLNAHDRRIVHLKLRNYRHVRTKSLGEGFYRKLIIYPMKTNSKKRTR